MDDLIEVRRVASALEAWIERFEGLITRAQSISSRVFDDQLKKDATQLKADLRQTAKNTTIDGAETHRSESERVFFGVAIRQASAELSMRRVISPSSPNWGRDLRVISAEFSYSLQALRKRYPDA